MVAQKLLAAGDDDAWLRAKIETAHFYADQVLPQAAGMAPGVTVGADQLFAIDSEIMGQ